MAQPPTPPSQIPPLSFTGYVRATNRIVALAEVPPTSIADLPLRFESYVSLVLSGHEVRQGRPAGGLV